MIHIEINPNKGKLSGDLKILNKLFNEFKIKHPRSFHIRVKGKGNWDGNIKYISEYGNFKVGLLPLIVKRIEELGHKYKIHDERPQVKIQPKIPNYIGENKLRPYQKDILKALLFNKVGGIDFRMGIANAATNSGKSTIMMGIHKAFKSKLNTLILTQDADWFNQAKGELPLLSDGEQIGFIRGTSKKQEWHKVNVAMVQTLSRNVLYFERELSNIDILLIDECDLSNNNMYKKVIERLFNASIRLGFSGTVFMSNLKKDAIKNMDIRTILGDQLAYVSKKWMMDKGYSTKVTVRIVEGNTDKPKERRDSKGRKIRLSYKEIYDELITDNRNRHRKSYKRTMHNINRGRLPCLIVCHYIPHVENLYNYFKNKLDRKKVRYTIAHCHNETKNRAKIISDFREGKIDILIASFIIRRGKNFPLLRYLQNASATDSKESVSQLMGRLERTHESKNRAYMDDLYDTGDKYLLRHSNHRIKLYKQEGVRLIRRIKKKVTL